MAFFSIDHGIGLGHPRFSGACCVLAAAAVLTVGGCQTFRQQGPTSKPVAEARQLSQRGLSAMQHGDWSTAELLLGEAVKTCPTDIEARRHYAEILWQRGERELAVQHVEKSLALTPDDLPLSLRAGEMYLALGRLDDARRSADQALDLCLNEPRAWALRGRVEQATGQYDRALADFHRALELCRDDRQLLLETAELYRRLNRPQRALSTLSSLRETYGPGEEPQQLLYLEGLALAALARYDDAAMVLGAALERGPATSELLYQLAAAQVAAGRRPEADRAIEQALAIDHNHAPSRALRQRIEVAARPVGQVFP